MQQHRHSALLRLCVDLSELPNPTVTRCRVMEYVSHTTVDMREVMVERRKTLRLLHVAFA
jgi:hypothetical protein